MNEQIKSIFIVTSPMEMICAIEAREYFNITNTKLLLAIFDIDRKVINFLLKESGNWDDIKYINQKSNYGLSWILLIKGLKKEKFDYLFSTVKNISSHFLFNLDFKSHYFIDDGTYTLNLVDYYKKNKSISERIALFYNKSSLKYTLIENIHCLFNHKFSGEYIKPSFFTYFEFTNSKELLIVNNDFKWFQSVNRINSKNELINDTIFIIGTCLVTDKIISLNYYISVIKSIVDKYRDKKIVYIFHRRETEVQLNKMKSQIDLSFQENEFIIEIDFFINNKVPTHIVGTLSSALFSLKKLYSDNLVVDSFVLDPGEIVEHRRDDYISMYKSQNVFVDNIINVK